MGSIDFLEGSFLVCIEDVFAWKNVYYSSEAQILQKSQNISDTNSESVVLCFRCSSNYLPDMSNAANKLTKAHTHIYIYIYDCECVSNTSLSFLVLSPSSLGLFAFINPLVHWFVIVG